MNTTIWRYEVEPFMMLPHGFKILSVQWQGNELMLWAAVDPGNQVKPYEIVQMETGRQFKDMESFKFLGTFQRHNGAHIFHLFGRELEPEMGPEIH